MAEIVAYLPLAVIVGLVVAAVIYLVGMMEHGERRVWRDAPELGRGEIILMKAADGKVKMRRLSGILSLPNIHVQEIDQLLKQEILKVVESLPDGKKLKALDDLERIADDIPVQAIGLSNPKSLIIRFGDVSKDIMQYACDNIEPFSIGNIFKADIRDFTIFGYGDLLPLELSLDERNRLLRLPKRGETIPVYIFYPAHPIDAEKLVAVEPHDKFQRHIALFVGMASKFLSLKTLLHEKASLETENRGMKRLLRKIRDKIGEVTVEAEDARLWASYVSKLGGALNISDELLKMLVLVWGGLLIGGIGLSRWLGSNSYLVGAAVGTIILLLRKGKL